MTSLPMVSKSTLQNAMLYANLVRKIHRIDPGFDVELIDRTLEPEEAERELHKRYHLRTEKRQDEGKEKMKEWRGFLDDAGIRHPRMQNFVMRQEKPPTEDDMNQLAYILAARPHKNVKMDIKRKARHAKTVRQYARHPNRYDVPGVDTPGSEFRVEWF